MLACLMLATFFVSCKKDDATPDDGNYVPTEDPYEKDDLPELNYGGETTTMLYWSDRLHIYSFYNSAAALLHVGQCPGEVQLP